MGTKFGFSGVNQIQNSNASTVTSTLGALSSKIDGLFIVGRVIDIILDDKHPKFKEFGGWTSIGTIEYVDTKIQSPNTTPGSSGLYAKPLSSNIRNYPIKEEIVLIQSAPNARVMDSNQVSVSYYFNVINIWNHPHHNAVPFFLTTDAQNTQNKSYQVTSLGSTNKVSPTPTSVNLGFGFKEYSNLHPLLPYIGDHIIEGRWGNSIRLGSTTEQKTNSWSATGDIGSPITIIRNGQPKDSSSEGYLPIIENINKDLSSIWLTSNQKIPIIPPQFLTTSYSSDTPDKPDQYIGSQIILNANRLLFNSNKDHILFSSTLTTGFNSVKGFNFDTNASFIVNSPVIRLGNKTTTNPMLKGNETVAALNTICDQLIKISISLSSLVEILPPAPQAAVNIAATEAISVLTTLKGQIGVPGNLKSKTNFLI